jgi:hypothetical protein
MKHLKTVSKLDPKMAHGPADSIFKTLEEKGKEPKVS